MARIQVPSKKGGFITINTDVLENVLGRWKSLCFLSAGLVGQMGNNPAMAAEKIDIEELNHHSISDYTFQLQEEMAELVKDLGEAFGEYAASVIDGSPENYNAIEIHGVREVEGITDVDPEYYSTYVHLVTGGIECVGDFATHEQAMQYGNKLANAHGWPVHDFSPNSQPVVKPVERTVILTAMRNGDSVVKQVRITAVEGEHLDSAVRNADTFGWEDENGFPVAVNHFDEIQHLEARLPIVRKITIVARGNTETDVEDAFEEAVTRLKNGCVSGSDQGENSGFYFENFGDVPANAVPA